MRLQQMDDLMTNTKWPGPNGQTGPGKVIVGATLSLDGFINDPRGSVAALYPDLESLRHTAPLREAIQSTGAVVMGWNAFAMAEDPDWYAGNYEFQVPIFVLTHAVPKRLPRQSGALTFTLPSSIPTTPRSALCRTERGGAALGLPAAWRAKCLSGSLPALCPPTANAPGHESRLTLPPARIQSAATGRTAR